jgi:molybdopterin-binding protein
MATYRLAEAAELLGVSDDTVRRWADSGRFPTSKTSDGHAGVEGAALAALARELAHIPADGATASSTRVSARNHLRGIVTEVKRDTVMAQVELCCGPYRVVSLMSREAADALGLEAGVVAVASIKATNVVVEVPQ